MCTGYHESLHIDMGGPYLVAEETSCVNEEIESTCRKLVHKVGHTFSGEQSHLPDAERKRHQAWN